MLFLLILPLVSCAAAIDMWQNIEQMFHEGSSMVDTMRSATHAETCWPLSSHLTMEAPVVDLNVNANPQTNITKAANIRRKESDLRPFLSKGRELFSSSLHGSDAMMRMDEAREYLMSGYPGATPECKSYVHLLFRTIDGSCNHPQNYGQSFTPLARILRNKYSDDVQAPRQFSVDGNNDVPLPSPRTVSRAIHPDLIATTDHTIFVMQWGQFTDHDIVSTPLPIADAAQTLVCCGEQHDYATRSDNTECFPIQFPSEHDFQGTCMEFVRSQPITASDGTIFLPRENMNIITSFVDGSTVYGSVQDKIDRLRDPDNPHLLRVTAEDNFLPDNGMRDCVRGNSTDICHLAGDDRVNEAPALTLMHTVFHRYHNILARDLLAASPDSPREQIFQQARAVVVAVIQNILFSEWLPIALGPSVRAKFSLDLGQTRTVYNSDQDPRVFQAFSTAAFRFGHSLIPRSLPLSPTRRPELRSLFFSPFEARHNLDTLASGILRAEDDEDHSQPGDRFLVTDVTSHLFENQEGTRRGFDLAAVNIQRGRDHGLPSYNDYRRRLTLTPVTAFTDPNLGVGDRVYRNVEDIDLFSGGLSEPPFDGGLVGETFSNIIGLQMHRLKFGDRFFFHSERKPFGFTDRQVTMLRTIRLAHVLCMTLDIPRAQLDVFKTPSRQNAQMDCGHLKWRHPKMSEFIHFPFY